MAFGQSAGPPASARQVAYLLSLLQKAGHTGFRDARGELGLTQRQAGGKFTSKEASELIDRLLGNAPDGGDEPVPAAVRQVAEQLDLRRAQLLAGIPAEQLADELARRGWAVIPP